MQRLRITKPIWVNGEPLNVGATVNLKPRLAYDLISTGAARELDAADVADSGSIPDSSTKKQTTKKNGKEKENESNRQSDSAL